ncbi:MULTISPECIES: replication initiator [unclassified Streptomyces]|uniref:replication initiator n=1 Tax=unclassified Streptomyces TaxID=2593676 RepID=UPI0013721756|nr:MULTISPECIES: replication initiator [unclassified Streptomyces]NEA05233.1 replication initiation protein [Streptomyces sp. SID10116]MYY82477.1 replication initiation protein [Streptomyces sp. SID335]MYZ19211.1 replication initiation protein [Streptomyces sp. SID337]NDZ91071.1 replication initiation protein [Streptomyces sp. SID10115]NEB45394.1 replication initiation protein [Streptomyces sp. SID339]
MSRPLDLRHVLSPGLRDLIDLANTDDFGRVTEQVRDLRGCTNPVNLHGWTVTTDQATKEVVRSYRSEDEPTGRLLTTCGNRRSSRCPSCSRVYAADTYHLIKAGLSGGKNVSESVREHPRVFVTLTAPSFGPVHNRKTDSAGKSRPCACGAHHHEDADELGTPLNPATYDYAGAVLWNAHAGQLWARFTTYLRRSLAAHLGMTQKELNGAVRISFAKVAEYQKRGLVHFHAVIRFDGPDGHTSAPPPWATFEALDVAVGLAVIRARLTVESDAIGERVIAWGDRFKVDPISALGDGELTDAKVAGYVAKYATKNAEGAGTVDRTLMCRPCAGHGHVRGPDGFRDLCADCDGTGQAEPLTDLPLQRHVRQMIRTAWDLGGLAEFADLKLWKWAHMLGFRGHFSSKSRAYSTTLGALRDVRRSWRLAQADAARARLGLPTEDENTTLVTTSSWTYLSSGYRPGEELLAAQVRYDRACDERAKAEGLPWL